MVEYLENDLAENEEDAKKIRRAETAAGAKRKRFAESGRGRGRGGYTQSRAHYSESSAESSSRYSNGRDNGREYNERSTDRHRSNEWGRSRERVYERQQDRSRREPIACYHCKGPHLRSVCEAYKEYMKTKRDSENPS